jgi:HK97 family phage prohead protease
VVNLSAWDIKRYKDNPVFLWGHNHSSPPIGKAINVKKDKDNGRLMFDVEFPTEDVYPFADTIYKLYKHGYLNAVSVGFLPMEWKDGNPEKNEPRRVYTKAELLELSGVTVPSNYNALVSARNAGAINDGEFVKMKAYMETGESDVVRIVEGEAQEAAPEQTSGEASIVTVKSIEDSGASKQTDDVIRELAESVKSIADDIQTIAKILGIQTLLKDEPSDAGQTGEKNAGSDAPESSEDESYFKELFDETVKLHKTVKTSEANELIALARRLKE